MHWDLSDKPSLTLSGPNSWVERTERPGGGNALADRSVGLLGVYRLALVESDSEAYWES